MKKVLVLVLIILSGVIIFGSEGKRVIILLNGQNIET